MQEITTLTNSPRQRWTLVLDNNETAEFYLYYLSRMQAWYYDLSYKNFTVNCSKCVLTPNSLRSFRRILPFGIAFLADDVLDPFQITDFSSGRVKMYILSKDEVDDVEKTIYISEEEQRIKIQFKNNTTKPSENKFKIISAEQDPTTYNSLVRMLTSTFDKSKFTVVGSPTITDDGIASGFSASNYITCKSWSLSSGDTWSIYFHYKTPTKIANTFAIWSTSSDYKVPRIALNVNGKFIWSVPNSTGTKWQKEYWGILHTISLNKDYYFKMYFNGTKYFLDYHTGSGNWVTMASFNSTEKVYNNNLDILVGRHSINSSNTDGSIDLKSFSITVDGEEVFNGNKTGVDNVIINSETVEIPYTLTQIGSKIVNAKYRDRLQEMYKYNKLVPYYSLDTVNKNFTVPIYSK